jgi:hypothetical protein
LTMWIMVTNFLVPICPEMRILADAYACICIHIFYLAFAWSYECNHADLLSISSTYLQVAQFLVGLAEHSDSTNYPKR